MELQDILAAIGVVFNGIPMMIFAMSYGFMAAPTAIGYAIGAGGMLMTGAVTPISIQAGTIALVGTMGKQIRERLSIALFAGLIMAVVGALGLIHVIMDFAGRNVVLGMQAGVGIILARVGIDMIKTDRFVGLISLISALAVYLPTQDLVYTIVVSVIVSSSAFLWKNKKPMDINSETYKFKVYKPVLSYNVVRGALALACLTIGSNIAFGNITAGMGGNTANINHLTLYSGLANVSALFGGAPVESIISATGAAPNPMMSGVLMMLLLGGIMIAGLLPKIARYVPMQSVAGFLVIIGAFATLPGNAFNAFADAARPEMLGAGVALLVTALTDPFIGLVAGVAIRLLTPVLGL
ncbi:MAG: NCS2 family permease [Oscillospiraceae bacterium]|nr:NCS2 family permease [Oscillospiraceae bacterium]